MKKKMCGIIQCSMDFQDIKNCEIFHSECIVRSNEMLRNNYYGISGKVFALQIT